jgi:valyl-tRNA synthetase
MPFITEEIWQLIKTRKDGESLMISQMPEHKKFNRELISGFDTIKEIISAVRGVRKGKNIPNAEQVQLLIKSGDGYDTQFLPVVMKMGNISEIIFTDKKPETSCASFIVKTIDYFIPVGSMIDVEGELSRIEEDLAYTRGFLDSVMKKLDNERFVQNAPETVINNERKKKADAETTIRALEERKKELENL